MALSRLTRVVVLVRDVRSAVSFYSNGLGLSLRTQTASHARLSLSDGVDLDLTAARSESQVSAGYSPLLTFEVEDLDMLIPRLIQHGAVLDGAILREPYGATASLRAPDGHMIGLHERAGEAADEIAAAKVARELLDSERKRDG